MSAVTKRVPNYFCPAPRDFLVMIREPCVSTVKVLSYRVPTMGSCVIELVKVAIFGSKLLLFLTMIFSRPQYKLISQSYELLVSVVVGALFDVESDSFYQKSDY